jgi:DNA-binding CsgD family transcriptional regulator
MQNVEFYTVRADVMYCAEDGIHHKLTESSREPILFIREKFEVFYPDCFKACEKKYERCRPNLLYFQFKVACRICKCNFGRLDPHRTDVDASGHFHFEDVYCPNRGECEYENIICHPRFESNISEAELRVLKLLSEGAPRQQIAQELFLSPHTIDNHIKNARARVGAQNERELVFYANKHNLFKF